MFYWTYLNLMDISNIHYTERKSMYSNGEIYTRRFIQGYKRNNFNLLENNLINLWNIMC